MSLRPAEIAPVPAATAQVAAAAFPKGCPAMRMRDALGTVYDDRMFASLYPARGQPAHSPWHLALVTVLQFAEGACRKVFLRTICREIALCRTCFDTTMDRNSAVWKPNT